METRIQSRDTVYAERFSYPFDTTLITATTEGTAQTIATTRKNSNAIVKRLIVANKTSLAATLSMISTPNGGSTHAEITGLMIPGNSNVDLSELVFGFYGELTVIKVYSGTASALTIGGYLEGRL